MFGFSLIKSSNIIYTLSEIGEWIDIRLSEPLTQEDFETYGINDLSIIPKERWTELDGDFEILTWTDMSDYKPRIELTIPETKPYKLLEDPSIVTYTEEDDIPVLSQTVVENYKTRYCISKGSIYEIYRNSEWTTINDVHKEGMTKEELESIPEEAWSEWMDEAHLHSFNILIGLWTDSPNPSMTKIPLIKSITINYANNMAPQMRDFTLNLFKIHSEHAVINGTVLDMEGDTVTIDTKIVDSKNNLVYSESINASHRYNYNRAFLFKETLAMGVNTITVTVTDQRGLSNSWSTNVEVVNLDPNIILVYNNRYFSSLIDDPDKDKVKIKIENTTIGKILEETGFIDTATDYKYIFKSGDTKFGVNNNIKVTIEDEMGGVISHTFTIEGVYRSLMFMDEDGNYYTDDQGNMIKPLDFELIRSGHTSYAKFVVSNKTSYDLTELNLSPYYGNLPEGTIIEFSEDNIGVEDWKERLILYSVFKNNDIATIKMRVTPPKNTVLINAEFGVDVSGTILVGRDGISDDDEKELLKSGYNIRY